MSDTIIIKLKADIFDILVQQDIKRQEIAQLDQAKLILLKRLEEAQKEQLKNAE